jgi:UDP-3-O-[3-hydroxymyristoyl] glucosamine N-acyltransferase
MKNFILVENPKLIYQRIVEKLFHKRALNGIHPTSVIHPKALIGINVNIGPFTYIGEVSIGDNAYIYGNVYIYDNVVIGNNVVIQAGTVIGSDGFGLTRNENREFENFPHIGGVIIEDNVEIGANTTIDRGTLGNTILMQGSKIDNLVHIAHNVEIGKHSAVVANSMVAGSTKIGNYCWVAPSASLRDRIHIPSESTIGMGAVVTKSILQPGTYTGNPAKELSEIVSIQKFLSNNCK